MNTEQNKKVSNKIDAEDKTLREILDIQKYTIDYFQREYKWERKQVEQLLVDLEASFFSSHDTKHEREDVENYNSYYLGPIVISNKGDRLSIIDGQQRLTTLTLLLIYLKNLHANREIKEPVENLIFSTKYGKKSYNLQIDERAECLDGLYNDGEYDTTGKEEFIQNLVSRYKDIEELFPDELKERLLPFFIDWVKDHLIFVKIATYSDENAYTIFETMNDRGLNLTPTEMLKGYLLSKINDSKLKSELNNHWKKRISEVREYTSDDLEFFKVWLRAKYADTIRPGRKGAFNEDFEKIGTSFHTWVKEKLTLIGLDKNSDFVDFVKHKFDFYSSLYIKIINAQNNYEKDLECLYYIGCFGVAYSLSYPLLVAPIKLDEDEKTINRKLNIVARYLETFSVYRLVNCRTLAQSSVRYTLYSLVKEIRDRSAEELITIFKKKIKEFNEDISGIKDFGLHQQNKRSVRYLLARITNHIEQQSGIPSSFSDYISDSIEKPFQVEHIWSDQFDQHKDEFPQRDEFNQYRNMIGGLLLLPKGTNQSFSNDSYENKLPHYLKENLLAQTLHEDCYKKNPNFIRYKNSSGLKFKPHKYFKKKDLLERTELYRAICESIWSLNSFDELLNY